MNGSDGYTYAWPWRHPFYSHDDLQKKKNTGTMISPYRKRSTHSPAYTYAIPVPGTFTHGDLQYTYARTHTLSSSISHSKGLLLLLLRQVLNYLLRICMALR